MIKPNKMNKITTSIMLFIIIIASAVMITAPFFKNENTEDYTNIHTKAICNETNYCQDYEISCNEETLVKIQPLTGAVVQHSEDWEDPRGEEAEKLC